MCKTLPVFLKKAIQIVDVLSTKTSVGRENKKVQAEIATKREKAVPSQQGCQFEMRMSHYDAPL